MTKFLTIVFAYMLSVSSAFAATDNADAYFAQLIAAEKGVKPANIRVIIVKGKTELEAVKSELKVLSLRIDDRFDNFYAKVVADNSALFEVNGKFERIRKAPVLSRKITRDETITAADITYIDINEKAVERGIITDANQLIGKGVAKTIFPNRAIMPASITAPKFISRGNTVKTIFKNNLLTIESSAIALEDGLEGDVIRLKNSDSNRIIRGKVTKENTVLISNNSKELASNQQ